MKLWTGLGLLAGFCAATSASAVVLFQNGFEGGTPGDYLFNGNDGFSQERFGVFNATNALRYRAPQNGVIPPQGLKLVEWNPPALPGGIAFYHANLGSELYKVRGQHRFMQASIKFWVGSGDLDDKELILTPNMLSNTYGATINMRTGAWHTLSGGANQDRSGTTALNRNAWNTLSMTHDFLDRKMDVRVNGVQLAFTDSGQAPTSEKYFSRLDVKLRQLSDVSSVYAVDQGGPVMYLDDYRVDAVPEPASILSLATLGFGLRAMKRRPKTAG